MKTQEMFHVKQDFTLSQEEADALVLIQRMPYRANVQAMACKAALFCRLYEDQTGRRVESKAVEDLLLDCLFRADYKPADDRLTECGRIVDALFERVGFDPRNDQ